MKKEMIVLLIGAIFLIGLVFIFLQGNLFKITGNAIKEDSLVAYYKFDGNPLDSSGNNNDGVIQGSPSFVEGVNKKSIELNENDYIKVLDTSFSFDETSNFTMSAWVFPRNIGNIRPIIAQGWTENIMFGVINKQVILGMNNAKRASNNSLQTNKWQYLAVTYNGSHAEYYINGVKDSTVDVFDTFNPKNYFYIGYEERLGLFFIGRIDELKVWDYDLTGNEILKEYNSYNVPDEINQEIKNTSKTDIENKEVNQEDLIEPETPIELSSYQKFVNWIKNLFS